MKDKINPRSFIFIKFLFTFGLFLNYIISAVAYFNIRKGTDNNSFFDVSIYLPIVVLLFVFSIVCLMVFVFQRKIITKKLDYNYTIKEKKLIWLCFSLSCFVVFFSVINLLTVYFISEKIYILIIVLISFQLILGIFCSILENLSRLNEQALINKIWFEDEIKQQNGCDKIETKILDKKEDFNPFMQEENDD